MRRGEMTGSLWTYVRTVDLSGLHTSRPPISGEKECTSDHQWAHEILSIDPAAVNARLMRAIHYTTATFYFCLLSWIIASIYCRTACCHTSSSRLTRTWGDVIVTCATIVRTDRNTRRIIVQTLEEPPKYVFNQRRTAPTILAGIDAN